MLISDTKKTKAANLGTTYFRLERLEHTLHIKIRCNDVSDQFRPSFPGGATP